jgi:hypothetical protein
MCFREIDLEGVDLLHVAQDSDCWPTLVNTVVIILIQWRERLFWPYERYFSFSPRPLLLLAYLACLVLQLILNKWGVRGRGLDSAGSGSVQLRSVASAVMNPHVSLGRGISWLA